MLAQQVDRRVLIGEHTGILVPIDGGTEYWRVVGDPHVVGAQRHGQLQCPAAESGSIRQVPVYRDDDPVGAGSVPDIEEGAEDGFVGHGFVVVQFADYLKVELFRG